MSVSLDTAIWRRIRMSKAKMLAAPPPVVIDDTNLSRGWARLLLQVLDGLAPAASGEFHSHDGQQLPW